MLIFLIQSWCFNSFNYDDLDWIGITDPLSQFVGVKQSVIPTHSNTNSSESWLFDINFVINLLEWRIGVNC